MGIVHCYDSRPAIKEYHGLPNPYGSRVRVGAGAGAGRDFPTRQKPVPAGRVARVGRGFFSSPPSLTLRRHCHFLQRRVSALTAASHRSASRRPVSHHLLSHSPFLSAYVCLFSRSYADHPPLGPLISASHELTHATNTQAHAAHMLLHDGLTTSSTSSNSELQDLPEPTNLGAASIHSGLLLPLFLPTNQITVNS